MLSQPPAPRRPAAGAACLLLAALAVACRPAIPASPPDRWHLTPDLHVAALQPGVWLHTSWRTLPGGARFPSNGLLVQAGDSLLLIDTAWGEEPTEALLRWADTTLHLPLARAIVTHAHDDRMGGLPCLRRRHVPVLTHPLTWYDAPRRGLALPDTLAGLRTPGAAVQVGSVEVFFPGPAHTPDNLMVWLPRTRILFGGCAVRPLSSPDLGNVADAVVPAWPDAIRRTRHRYGKRARLVVPSHGSPAGPRALTHTLRLLSR
ncbi:MAG TPA: subclass B1 metallo-beta-lactamase [bacterium]|nr:subclass B1 metallo-beta-lactamase [bacterium]